MLGFNSPRLSTIDTLCFLSRTRVSLTQHIRSAVDSPSIILHGFWLPIMPATSPNLACSKYGYDFVVATTQASINSTMLNFLASRQEPTVNVCFV